MNKRRLLKLAKHLESGKLGHKKFDTGVQLWNPFPRFNPPLASWWRSREC